MWGLCMEYIPLFPNITCSKAQGGVSADSNRKRNAWHGQA